MGRLQAKSNRRSKSVARGLLLAALSSALVAQAPQVVAQQVSRIAYVDMKRLLDNAPKIVSGRLSLQLEFAERDKQLKAQESRLGELEAGYKRDAAILPADVAKSQAQEIEVLRRNIKRLRDKMREDLAARSAEEINRIWPQIQASIIAFARENNLDLVLQSPVIYAGARIDITDKIIERLKRERAGAQRP